MADGSLLIVVRVEKRLIPMRPVIAAVMESLSSKEFLLDLAEVEPRNPDKIDIADRVQFLLQDVVATARAQQKAILSVHVALSQLTFVSERLPSRDVDVAIIAAAGHFSPLSFSVRANPSVEVSKPILDCLSRIEARMRKEMPPFEAANWESGIALRQAVIETLFQALFAVASTGLDKSDDDVLQ